MDTVTAGKMEKVDTDCMLFVIVHDVRVHTRNAAYLSHFPFGGKVAGKTTERYQYSDRGQQF